MGDGARIESTNFIDAVGCWYVARPGADNRDRIGVGILMGANFDVFVDDHNSFRVILAGTAVREEPLVRTAVTTANWASTAVGGTVETHFAVASPWLFAGVGLNPRAIIYAQGLPPEFELGVVGRVTAAFGNWRMASAGGGFGVTLSVGGGLRLTDIERSSFEAGLGVFLNLF